MIRKLVFAAAAVSMSVAVQAAEEELYIGAGLGTYEQGSFDASYLELTAGVQITEVTSVEASYQYFEEVEVGGADISTSAVNLSLLAEKGIDERLGLIGRVFLQLLDQDGTSNSESNLGFGAGITYKVGEEKTTTLRLEYRAVDPSASDDANGFSLGIVKYFD